MRNFIDIADVSHVLVDEIRSRPSNTIRRTAPPNWPRNRLLHVVNFLSPCPDAVIKKPKPPVRNTRQAFVNGGADMACLHCSAPFAHRPAHVVERFSSKRRCFFLSGYFCSWNCAKAMSATSEFGGAKCANLYMMFRLMGGKGRGIRHAQPRAALAQFGGSLARHEFDKDCVDTVGPDSALPPPYSAVLAV
jgi:hypothetical protein